MAITADDIHNQSFTVSRKGYDLDEVDVFLEHVAEEIDALNNHIAELEEELAVAQAQADEAAYAGDPDETQYMPMPAAAEPAAPVSEMTDDEKDARIAELEAALAQKQQDDNIIAQALITAQRSGEEIISQAKNTAVNTTKDAEEEAARILDKANAERQRILDVIADLQKDREAVRAGYQGMLRDFISDANKKLTELGAAPALVVETAANTGELPGFSTGAAAAFEQDNMDSMAATYVTPQAKPGAVTPATPKPSQPAKDLSGYGDADADFGFDDLD